MPGLSPLGRLLAAQAQKTKPWLAFLLALLAAIAAAGLAIPNHHPHFGIDAWPFFWPAFGLGLGLVLIFMAKKVIQPILKRPEDHYGDL
jgi:peptidoglycan/LPS O-acetylase OafA/YrhL